LLAVKIKAKVTGGREINAGVASVVHVKELSVQKVGEVFSGRWISEQILLWRQLVEVRDVLGHVGPSLPLVGGHERLFAIQTTLW
jgi:uncharacterized membrane protein